jgi:hypothetical protein
MFGSGLLQKLRFTKSGIYKLRSVYSTAAPNVRDYFGDEKNDPLYGPSPDILRAFNLMPKVRLVSNEVNLRVVLRPTDARCRHADLS